MEKLLDFSNMVELAKIAEINQDRNNEQGSTAMSTFGLYISSLRQWSGLTQGELASISGCELKNIENLEFGMSAFREAILLVPFIAKALKINPRTLTNLLIHLVLD